ncbi:MAG: hypothetical protein KatS3mg124_1096 [Porticoccaceae bacterium]|nr:MAG: hypothetical protein KatS3mg124_1096 [Porticoccaceae bacterium]
MLTTVSQAGFRQFTIEYRVEGKAVREMGEKVVYHMDRDRFRQDLGEELHTSLILEKRGERLRTTMIDHREQTYLRHERNLDEDERFFLFGSLSQPDNPCGADPKYRCEPLGEGELLGYAVRKWRVSDEDGKATEAWYAPDLGYFLKLVASEEDLTLTAVRVEDRRPPAALFAPPPDYRGQDLEALFGAFGGAGSTEEEAPAAPAEGEAPPAGAADQIRDALRGLFGQ